MIKGEKIYLRPITKEDLVHLNRWKNDEEVYRFLGGGFVPVSINQQEKWLENLIDMTGNNKRFIICDNEDNPLGMVGLYVINWIHRICEIGIFIGEKRSHGKGYGKEACLLIEKYAKNYLNIRKIKLNVVLDNEAAYNMWITLGYMKAGVLKEERFIDGKYYNLLIMEKFL